jgi:hypothetical protein
MGHNPNESGYSFCIVYENGKRAPFLMQSKDKMVESLEGPEPGEFAMVTIPCHNAISQTVEQSFSSKNYSDVIFSFNENRRADLEIIKINDKIRVSTYGKVLQPDIDGWIRIEKRNKIIGLLVLPLEDILDRVLILKRKPEDSVGLHFVLYYGKYGKKLPSLANSDLMVLAKLRAIENRVGILILTDEMREALKTNNYKNIQRFKEKNGLFGFNEENLGGPESIFSQSGTTGIPEEFRDKYLELL